MQADEHPLAVWRDIERNPLRAKLVRRAEDWRWSEPAAATVRRRGGTGALERRAPAAAGGLDGLGQRAETAAELEALRRCVARGRPFGAEAGVADVVRRLGLEITARPRGRPRRPLKAS